MDKIYTYRCFKPGCLYTTHDYEQSEKHMAEHRREQKLIDEPVSKGETQQ